MKNKTLHKAIMKLNDTDTVILESGIVSKPKEDMTSDIWGNKRGSTNSNTSVYPNQHQQDQIIGNDPELYNFSLDFTNGEIKVKGILMLSIEGLSTIKAKKAISNYGNDITKLALDHILSNKDLVKP